MINLNVPGKPCQCSVDSLVDRRRDFALVRDGSTEYCEVLACFCMARSRVVVGVVTVVDGILEGAVKIGEIYRL